MIGAYDNHTDKRSFICVMPFMNQRKYIANYFAYSHKIRQALIGSCDQHNYYLFINTMKATYIYICVVAQRQLDTRG